MSATGCFWARPSSSTVFRRYSIVSALLGPARPTGRLSIDEDTFKTMTRLHPQLRNLHELRVTLGQMREFDSAGRA